MSELYEKIYAITRRIPFGAVTTYGQIARLLGNPRMSRVVGYAMSACGDETVPCHRVVNRFGGLSDGFMPCGRDTHRMLLEIEGVSFRNDGTVDMETHMWYGTDG